MLENQTHETQENGKRNGKQQITMNTCYALYTYMWFYSDVKCIHTVYIVFQVKLGQSLKRNEYMLHVGMIVHRKKRDKEQTGPRHREPKTTAKQSSHVSQIGMNAVERRKA